MLLAVKPNWYQQSNAKEKASLRRLCWETPCQQERISSTTVQLEDLKNKLMMIWTKISSEQKGSMDYKQTNRQDSFSLLHVCNCSVGTEEPSPPPPRDPSRRLGPQRILQKIPLCSPLPSSFPRLRLHLSGSLCPQTSVWVPPIWWDHCFLRPSFSFFISELDLSCLLCLWCLPPCRRSSTEVVNDIEDDYDVYDAGNFTSTCT